jgi:hypothetical protein
LFSSVTSPLKFELTQILKEIPLDYHNYFDDPFAMLPARQRDSESQGIRAKATWIEALSEKSLKSSTDAPFATTCWPDLLQVLHVLRNTHCEESYDQYPNVSTLMQELDWLSYFP